MLATSPTLGFRRKKHRGRGVEKLKRRQPLLDICAAELGPPALQVTAPPSSSDSSVAPETQAFVYRQRRKNLFYCTAAARVAI